MPCRACRVLEQSPDSTEASDALSECVTLVELLEGRQAALTATLEGQFPELRATVWQSEASVQAAVQVREQGSLLGAAVSQHPAAPSVVYQPVTGCSPRTTSGSAVNLVVSHGDDTPSLDSTCGFCSYTLTA